MAIPDPTPRRCRINANRELYALTREQLQLLYDAAKPGPDAEPLAWWPEASPV